MNLRTVLSDIVQRNSYWDGDSKEIVIGQDTLVSGAGIFLGNVLPLEVFLDSAVNISLGAYDVRGLSGNPVLFNGHTWELRVNYENPQAHFLGYDK